MAIKQVIEIEVEAGSAKTNLKDIGAVIQEQKDITIEFEKELRNLEAQLANTSSSNMGKQKVLKTRVTDLKDALKDQRLSLKELNNERGKATKVTEINTKSLSQNYGVVQLVDQVTGGLASQVRSVVDANKLFNISLKGTKTALIATGVGAFIVALGLIVAYWDDIVQFINGSNKALERQIKIQADILAEEERSLKILDSSVETLKRQGKTEEEIRNFKKEQLELVIAAQAEEIRLEKIRLEGLQRLKTEGGASLQQFARGIGNIIDGIYEKIDGFNSFFGFDSGIAAQSGRANEVALEWLFGTDEDIEKSKKLLDDYEEQIIATQNRLDGIINKENETVEREQIESVVSGDLTSITLKSQQDLQDALIVSKIGYENELNRIEEENAEIRGRIARKEAQAKIEAIEQYSNIASQVGNLLGRETAAGKTASAASALIATYLSANKAYQSQLTIPTPDAPVRAAVAAGVAIASGLANVKAILAVKTPNGGGGSSSSAPSAPRAPAFNLVKGSASNQIAESIQGQNKPIKAYVIGSDVTTSQSLDRQIEGDSTL